MYTHMNSYIDTNLSAPQTLELAGLLALRSLEGGWRSETM